MNNPGPSDIDQSASTRVRHPRLVLLLGAVAVLLAVFIGTQVLGVLFGIVFPAMPPLPRDAHEISHENKSYGEDTWLYSSDQDACEVLAFYEAQASNCEVAPTGCEATTTVQSNGPSQHVARCYGELTFSVFAMSWDVSIGIVNETTGSTQFRLNREIYWTGNVPRPTPEFPSG